MTKTDTHLLFVSATAAMVVLAMLALGIPTRAAAATPPARSPQSAEASPAIAYAPNVPPPITRHEPAIVRVHLDAVASTIELAPGIKYDAWTFNGKVPGPMIRARVGDTLEVTVTNHDTSGMLHSVDFHAVVFPAGGARATEVAPGKSVTARFPLRHPGLFVYHCGTPPVPDHIANGMYGMILVEPREGLPPVDHEYYVLQSEFYAGPLTFQGAKGWQAYYGLSAATPRILSGMLSPESQTLTYDRDAALAEQPTFVVFNGSYTALRPPHALTAKTGETVRVYFGDIGPNLDASFHTIGEIFTRVWRNGGLVDPPSHGLQTVLVPAGGAVVTDMVAGPPGDYSLVDHSIFRVLKGAFGVLRVKPADH